MLGTRRDFLKAACALAGCGIQGANLLAADNKNLKGNPYFLTRGIVLVPSDLKGMDWPALAQEADLTTIGIHGSWSVDPQFLEQCSQRGLQVEYELHALNSLLPRDLFAKDPTLFRMDENGKRQRGSNLCVHSSRAIEIVCENAVKRAETSPPSTGRHFFWPDDGQPMCRCEKCREFSDSDQAVIVENAMLTSLRKKDPRATLAHLAYLRTMSPPTKIKPLPGVFLEYAPYSRQYDKPLSQKDVPGIKPGPEYEALGHGKLLDLLDANLAVFGREGAQALEYWLDLSRFVRLRTDPGMIQLPWNQEVFEADIQMYSARGIRHLTSFGVRLDGKYVNQYGMPPIVSYGKAMSRWKSANDKAVLGPK